MTNEEKAKELLEEWGDCESIDIEECRKRTCCNICQTERVLILMAEWKDKQHQQTLIDLNCKLEEQQACYEELKKRYDEVTERQKKINKQKKHIDDNLPQTSIPRDLCKRCYEWVTQEDVGFNDIPHCTIHDYACHNYLIHKTDKCPNFIEL